MGEKDGYGQCKACGFTTYFTAQEQQKQCPYCHNNGTNRMIRKGVVKHESQDDFK